MSAPVELLVLRGARSVEPGSGVEAVIDVVVERGRIVRLGAGAGAEPAASERARVVEAHGQWVLPAFVDLHAHLRQPGHEHKEDITTGLAAAAAGGYAHVCAMPNTDPVNDTRAVTELMLDRAGSVVGPTLHPIAAITKGQAGRELTDMADLRKAGAVGVSDDGVCVMSSAVMRRAFEQARDLDLPVIQHAEDHELTAGAVLHEGAVSRQLGLRGWPRVAEDIIVARDILLAEYLRARYHVAHVSTLGSVRLVREAKARGIAVTCEVTPHHLLLTDAALLGYDTACKVNPPLREEADVAALREALADGTIDAIATDHAPHSPRDKEGSLADARPGMMGLELCFGLLAGLVGTSGIALGRLIDALSTSPARIAGIDPPRLREGALAELVLVDPDARWKPEAVRLRTKSKNSPFMSRELRGRVLLTLARGTLVHDALGESP